MARTLQVLCFGAHPDDCDFRFGGTAMKYRALGHRVTFVSMTNGNAGHHEAGGGPLARRRYAEAQAAARVADIEYRLLDIDDGSLTPTLELRKEVVRIIREAKPDLVLCHRPCDYHPDHRAVGQVVQDASYLITVPDVAPLTPHLDRTPAIGCFYDGFREPVPYRIDVAIDIDDVFERKVDMGCCHASQVFEWLPYNAGQSAEVPESPEDRRAWFAARMVRRDGAVGDRARDVLVRLYGAERGNAVRAAETVSFSEYGRVPRPDEYRDLFPFLP